MMIEEAAAGSSNQPLVGIEESAAACAAARINAARRDVPADYIAGRVEALLERTLSERPARRFVLNPGRAGCRGEVVGVLASLPEARIAYLSCDADTLARDLAALVRGGRRVRDVAPLDFMPHTDHVETLALLD